MFTTYTHKYCEIEEHYKEGGVHDATCVPSNGFENHGCIIMEADSPEGPFKMITDGWITPAEWDCIDGTLYVEDGKPYMVFCHEWVQIKDGEIWAMQLTEDMSAPAAEPFKLFSASECPFVSELHPGNNDYVTDGPFLYKEDGKHKMIWSSLNNRRYLVLGAESENGSIKGKWIHTENMFDFDGGHAMIFETLEGKRMISLHSPNTADLERAMFLEF